MELLFPHHTLTILIIPWRSIAKLCMHKTWYYYVFLLKIRRTQLFAKHRSWNTQKQRVQRGSHAKSSVHTGEGKTVHPVEKSRKAVRSIMSSTFKLMPVSSSTCQGQNFKESWNSTVKIVVSLGKANKCVCHATKKAISDVNKICTFKYS